MTILKQYYVDELAHASYLIADERSGQAAVVDPQREIGQYVEDARRLGCTIRHVFLTHFHADFVAGHLELREQVGAAIHLGARARAEYPFAALQDGATVTLGELRLVALETPGHSPESISLLLYDPEHGDEPHAVLTGDTLLIGDVGRPDLRGAIGWSADRLASELYDSLHDRLAGLPDDTLVYPAHGAGSLCARSTSTETVSTVGAERAHNHALQPMTRQRFIDLVTSDLPDAPPYFTYDALLNSRERPTLEQSLERSLRPLTVDEAGALARDGAQLLDARAPAEFVAGHLKGSINISLDGSYETWCGTVLDPHTPIVVTASPGREIEAVKRLGRIGFDLVEGYIAGGYNGAEDMPVLGRVDQIDAGTLAQRLASADPPVLVDVRNQAEWRQGRIEHAVHLPLPRLAERLDLLPGNRAVVVYCGTGYRSAIAASLLRRAGVRQVSDLAGGLAAAPALVGAARPANADSDQTVPGGQCHRRGA